MPNLKGESAIVAYIRCARHVIGNGMDSPFNRDTKLDLSWLDAADKWFIIKSELPFTIYYH